MRISARPHHRRMRPRRRANLVTLLREKKAAHRERELRLVGENRRKLDARVTELRALLAAELDRRQRKEAR